MEPRPLTREDVPDIVLRVREQVREELHLCFHEWLPRRTGAAAAKTSEDPEGAPRAGFQSLPRWRSGALMGREADTEASPRPALFFAPEANQGSPPGLSYGGSEESDPAEESTSSHRGTSGIRAPGSPYMPRAERIKLHELHELEQRKVQEIARNRSRATGVRSSLNSNSSSSNKDNTARSSQSSARHLSEADPMQGDDVNRLSTDAWDPNERGSFNLMDDREGFFRRHYKMFIKNPGHGSTRAHVSRAAKDHAKRHGIVSQKGLHLPDQEDPELTHVERLVASPCFDYGTGLLILLNAASIGFQTDYCARNGSLSLPPAIRGIELFFCVVFTLELLLRMAALKTRFFCSPDRMWNIFDFLLVGLQLTEELLAVFTKADDEATTDPNGGGGMNTDMSMLRILRILRLIRIIRLVRILRVIGELRTIVVSIIGSLRSLCWTVLLLLIMMYLLGVYMTQLILDYRLDSNLSPSSMTTEQGYMTTVFGNLGMAMISLYQAITGGLNWHMLVDPLMHNISPWLAVLIGLYVAFSLFALMNVVTGVFVESALATAKSDRDMFLLQFVRKLFAEADKDASGAITWDEFKDCLGSEEMKMYFEAFDLDIHEAKNLFHLLDIDGSGQVEFEEFVNGCFRLRGPAKALDLATFMSGFSTWNIEWVNFARRIDWQLRMLMKQSNLSMRDGPKFKAKLVSANAPGGFTLVTPVDSETDDEEEEADPTGEEAAEAPFPSTSSEPRSTGSRRRGASPVASLTRSRTRGRSRVTTTAFFDSENDVVSEGTVREEFCGLDHHVPYASARERSNSPRHKDHASKPRMGVVEDVQEGAHYEGPVLVEEFSFAI